MVMFFVIVGFLLALAGGVFWYWRQRIEVELREGADFEWAHLQKNEPALVDHLDDASFYEIYRKVNMPRFPGYLLATVTTFFVTLPLSMILLTVLQWIGSQIGLVPEPLEVVRYINLGEPKPTQSWQCNAICQLYIAEAFGGFYYFFGMIFSWLAVVYFYVRRFHARRPGYLRDELLLSRS